MEAGEGEAEASRGLRREGACTKSFFTPVFVDSSLA